MKRASKNFSTAISVDEAWRDRQWNKRNGGIKTQRRDREIFAYFPTQEKAQQAARKVSSDVNSTQVDQVLRCISFWFLE